MGRCRTTPRGRTGRESNLAGLDKQLLRVRDLADQGSVFSSGARETPVKKGYRRVGAACLLDASRIANPRELHAPIYRCVRQVVR